MTRSLPLFVMSGLALCVAQAVQAADVDVYGIVDVGMHYTDSKYGDSSTTMDSGISKGSRIGLRGSENLGNGYAVVFNLETGFTLDDGGDLPYGSPSSGIRRGQLLLQGQYLLQAR